MRLARRRLRESSNCKKCKKTLLAMETRPGGERLKRKGVGMKRREFIALLGGWRWWRRSRRAGSQLIIAFQKSAGSKFKARSTHLISCAPSDKACRRSG